MSFKVIGIGEVLWDLLPSGPQLGGAPANFAYHAHALGAQASVVTRVGRDDLGQEIIRRFAEQGIGGETVQVDGNLPTGTVTVLLDKGGVPQFTIHENVAWDQIVVTEAALRAVETVDVVCFGSLAQRSEASRFTIQQLAAAAPETALRVFDVNLRQQYYSRQVIERSLWLTDVFKLNDAELPVIAEMFALRGSDQNQIEQLAQQFELRVVALTRGPEGSLLFDSGRWSEHKPRPVQVVDTVGAGDAFAATLCLGLLCRMDLDKINALANEVASYVCSCAGATPPLPAELRQHLCVGESNE